MGPLLFLVYINDLSRSSQYFKFILFADDTNIFASDTSEGVLFRKVRDELGMLSDWFACNKLTLNYDKTEFINYSKPVGEVSANNVTLNIDGKKIRNVSVSKFLGVRIY